MFVKILETWNTWTFLTCPRKGGGDGVGGKIAFLGSAWQRARLSTCTNLRTKFFLLDNPTSSQSQRNLWSRNSVPELSMSKTWKSGNTDKKSESARLKISISRWLIIQTFIPQNTFFSNQPLFKFRTLILFGAGAGAESVPLIGFSLGPEKG